METVRILRWSLLVLLVVLQNGLTQDDSAEERLFGGIDSLFKPPKIEIFYNPLEGKSLSFIATEIYPVIQSVLGSFINLALYPVAGCNMKENVTTENGTLPVKLACAMGAKQEMMSSNHLHAIDFFMKQPNARGIFDWGKQKLKNMTINTVTYLMCDIAKK